MSTADSEQTPAVKGPWLLGPLYRFAGRLRFPWLFGLVAAVFGLDLLIPDLLPFVDEILLGLMTLWLGSWRVRKQSRTNPPTVAIPGQPTPPKLLEGDVSSGPK